MIKKGFIFLTLFLGISTYTLALAEIKVFEKEVEEAVSRGQSQDQVEAFALQKAKRLAVEEAGTYISSLTVVKDYQLQKDEVTALASGIVQSRIMGVPAVRVENGVVHVKVKARIDVDTRILDSQIKSIMKDKGTLKKLEDSQRKVAELEKQLANLKSPDVKRFEEINSQAIALERDRDKQRLFREEQALKAKGELNKAEAERIAKEREMQNLISRRLAKEEQDRRAAALAIAIEQDQIKRAQLENEQHWNDLSRQAKLAQDSWVVIDDSLSLQQAIEEAKALKAEIANLKNRLDYQYQKNNEHLKAAYAQQRALIKEKRPSPPADKDQFETKLEYDNRVSAYKRQVRDAETKNTNAIKELVNEESHKYEESKGEYIAQQIRVLKPFAERLQTLQSRKFILPEGSSMTVDLGTPDAEHSRFPIHLKYKDKSWSTWWYYTDRNRAKDFYQTKSYLKAEGLFQLDESSQISIKFTATRVSHLGTKEVREFTLEKITTFSEIEQFSRLKTAMTKGKREDSASALRHTLKIIGTVRDPVIESFRKGNNEGPQDPEYVSYEDGTILYHGGPRMWAATDNGQDISWQEAKKYCENYRAGGYTDWRLPTDDELGRLHYHYVDWKDKNSGSLLLPKLIKLTGCCIWTSQMHRRTDPYYWDFSDDDSKVKWTSPSSKSKYRVLPVRDNTAVKK